MYSLTFVSPPVVVAFHVAEKKENGDAHGVKARSAAEAG